MLYILDAKGNYDGTENEGYQLQGKSATEEGNSCTISYLTVHVVCRIFIFELSILSKSRNPVVIAHYG